MINTPLDLIQEPVRGPQAPSQVVVGAVPCGEVEGRVADLPGVAVVGGYEGVAGFQRDMPGTWVIEKDERAPGGGFGGAVVFVVVGDFVP